MWQKELLKVLHNLPIYSQLPEYSQQVRYSENLYKEWFFGDIGITRLINNGKDSEELLMVAATFENYIHYGSTTFKSIINSKHATTNVLNALWHKLQNRYNHITEYEFIMSLLVSHKHCSSNILHDVALHISNVGIGNQNNSYAQDSLLFIANHENVSKDTLKLILTVPNISYTISNIVQETLSYKRRKAS